MNIKVEYLAQYVLGWTSISSDANSQVNAGTCSPCEDDILTLAVSKHSDLLSLHEKAFMDMSA